MPTRTADEHPFAPRRAITRDELLAYAEGRLPPARMHEVERAVEADALVRDAAEGLRVPGARIGLDALDAARPRGARAMNGWVIGSLVAVIGITAWMILAPDDTTPLAERGGTAPTIPEPLTPLRAEEIATAQEQPESLLIGHERLALHAQPLRQRRAVVDPEPVERDGGIEPIAPREPVIARGEAKAEPRIERKRKSSRQLVFLHDLKLVHPLELYTADPVLALADEGVAARFADATVAGSASETVMMPYLEFMDGAVARFAASDHKGCLDDLRFVLGQYPDDVNALFYAGLCSYNLGMYARASALLQRAATHPVDVFDEEALWYGALTTERLGGKEAAREAFARIAAQGGFYAEQARMRLAR